MPATPTRSDKLSWWIDHRLNVLFRGRHGVGKSAIVQQAFEAAGLRWRRFSATPPLKSEQIFEDASVEALFFDDLQLMPRKFSITVMDLLRNGSERLPNLKVVWGAVRLAVDDDDFDLEQFVSTSVEPFNVTVHIPFKPNLPYFNEVFGSEIAEAAAAWWDKLPEEFRWRVSPRALEEAVRRVGPVSDVAGLGAALDDLRSS